MKIYTKTGDGGTTGLYGGTRVEKNDMQIEAYGTVDELSSCIGQLMDRWDNGPKEDLEFLVNTVSNLFVLNAHLANDGTKSEIKLPEFSAKNIFKLEEKIDAMERGLEAMTHFILPFGHPLISWCHVVRTVCRRAERRVVSLQKIKPQYQFAVSYLNRLSDYFFVLSRFIAVKEGVEEKKWIS